MNGGYISNESNLVCGFMSKMVWRRGHYHWKHYISIIGRIPSD